MDPNNGTSCGGAQFLHHPSKPNLYCGLFLQSDLGCLLVKSTALLVQLFRRLDWHKMVQNISVPRENGILYGYFEQCHSCILFVVSVCHKNTH